MASVFEAGNHIAHLADGGNRRRYADLFVSKVREALRGDAPWRPIRPPDLETIAGWMDEFTDCAMRGMGMGDLSIVKEWQAARDRHPNFRVLIWSLDQDLAAYDHRPGRR